MTKISVDELLREINLAKQAYHGEYNSTVAQDPGLHPLAIERCQYRIDALCMVERIIRQIVDLENRKCKKCGDIHSCVIDCSDRMTFNKNSHTYIDERIYYCNKCSEMHVSNLPNPHFKVT